MDQQATRTKPRSYTGDEKRQVVDLVVSGRRTCGFRRKSATVSDLMSAGDSEMKSAIPI